MKPLNVLFAEDSEEDMKLMLRELRVADYDVTWRRVETADALKDALRNEPWDIILCDFAFPHFSGDEALRLVKESGLDLPFIYVSGKIGEDTAVKAMKAGAHDYVMKNNLARLAAAVDRELAEAQVRKESRRAEAMMRASEHKYRHLFERMSDAAFLVGGENGTIFDVNPQAEQLLNKTRAEIMGMRHRDLYPSKQEPRFLANSAANGKTGDEESDEVEVIRKDGSVVPTDLRVSHVELQGHPVLLLLFRDITRRRQIENELRNSREQLRALAAHLQQVREEERTRVARGIHDELGQMLTCLKMDLRWMEQDLEKMNDPRLNSLFDKAVSATELTDSLAKSVQRIAAELRPGILDRLGLVMALSYEADQFQQRTGIVCHINTPEDEPLLPAEIVTAVFRIFQEAMTNVARHSSATEVNIQLHSQPECLNLEIRDNGKGIRAADLLGPRSLGVLGMKERARQFGGDITFRAGTTGGTIVTLRIPQHKEEQQHAVCSN